MGDSFFKVVIHNPSWDVRSEAKRLGFLYQLFIDAKQPKEVFIKYKSVKDAERARISFAANENVERVESMEKWDIRPKKPTEFKQPDDTVSCAGSTSSRMVGYQHRPPVVNGPLMSEPLPLMMGLFNMCCSCRKGGAAFQCFVCGTYYCGEICQRNDWPAHIVQCLPRLVRTQSGFVPIEPQPMGFPDLHMMQPHGNLNHNNNNGPVQANRKQQVSNQPTGSKEGGQNQKQGNNNRPKASLKPSEQQQKPVKALPTKGATINTVPTNVLKNLALKRNQQQGTVPLKAANEESQKAEAPASKIEGNISKQTSMLIKRVQQKVEPKREIRHAPFPQEGECVKISYVTDDMVYVYRSGQEANGQSNRYLDFVKRSVECAREVKQMLKVAPSIDAVAFAPFDGDYYRAMVKSIAGTRVTVFFPDFGNTQTVEWTEMKAIPDKEIQYGMCYTHGVKIDGVATFSPVVKAFLSELPELEEFELTKVSDDKLVKTVDMRHVQELYQLSAKLLAVAKTEQTMAKVDEKPAVKETVPIVDPATYVPFIADEFDEIELPMGEEIALTIVEASELTITNQMSVILESDNEAFGKVVSDCNRYGNMDPHPYHPESDNEVFLLKFDGIWCRAMVVGSGLETQYYMIDLGILRTLNEPAECRRYPRGILRKTFVTECYVDNPNALGDDLEEHGSNEHLLGKTLKGTIQPGSDGEGSCLQIHCFLE